MDLTLSEQQRDLVAATRGYADKNRTTSSDVPESRWREFAELGWFGLTLPERAGGLGATALDESLICREIGRALLPGPLLPTMLAARIAAEAGRADLTADFVEGRRRAGWALPDPPSESTRAADARRRVLEPRAPWFVVTETDRWSLIEADAGSVTEHRCLDESVSLGRLTLDPETAVTITAPETVRSLRTALSTRLAAILAGIAEAALEAATDHAKTRMQFGHPIGAFQAIKHRCADMAIAAESAWACAHFAAMLEQEDDRGAHRTALEAQSVAERAAFGNCRGNIQIHGAIGTTFEHSAHRLLERTHVTTRSYLSAPTELVAHLRAHERGGARG
ncbi:acyl-CoA dehydrogenase family protein [Nocardia harenae]|uniref:acyl-CoA dehydrogenase family protein n=1 Tax=Nocardia harenae TaxID=358707 RepID=UPI0008323371|nr:acyl-CoA dehydrogenase family protein [Nocardia harenae]